MFIYMCISKEDEATFFSQENSDYYFLLKISENEAFSIEYGYRDGEFTEETADKVPNGAAFIQKVNNYASKDNPVFMEQLQEYLEYLDEVGISLSESGPPRCRI